MNKNKSGLAEQNGVPLSPMEKTLDNALDRHGANIVNSENLFDRNMVEGLVVSDALKSKHHDNAKAAAKLGETSSLQPGSIMMFIRKNDFREFGTLKPCP